MVTAVVVLTKALVSDFLSSTLRHRIGKFNPIDTVKRKHADFILGCNYLPRSGENSHKFDIMNFIGSLN